MKPLSALEIIQNFDRLPDDACVPRATAAVILNMSERTLRRHPILKWVELTPRLKAVRAGDIRALVRGTAAQATAA